MTTLPLSTPADAVGAQFTSRPNVASVVQALLSADLAYTFPTLQLDLNLTQVATPLSGGGWTLQPLMPLVLDFLGNGTPVDFSDRGSHACFFTDRPPAHLKTADGKRPPPQVIEVLIKALPAALPTALQDALADYWRALADTGVTRWRWLSELLMNTLNLITIRQTDLETTDRQALHQLVDYPDRDQRIAKFGNSAVHAYCPLAKLKAANGTQTVYGPDLVLVNGQSTALLYSPSGTCERFTNADAALQAWMLRVTQEVVVEHVALQRLEPDGNLFDTQAALILDQQLQQIATLSLPGSQGLETLEAVYRHITDPYPYFSATGTPVLQSLATPGLQAPTWLQQAPAADRARYRHYCLQLASAKKRSGGRTFLSDIPDIRAFAREALAQRLKSDAARLNKTQASELQPDDLLLTFSVAVGYPGGAGYVEKVEMSLTDLAIKNLHAKPSGTFTIAHRNALPLPTWLTADYIQANDGPIQQVDIGKTYPERLNTLLLGGNTKSRQREQQFAEQAQVVLPMQALELSLKQEHGFTPEGAAYVAALMGNTSDQRRVNGAAMVIRHLALVRKPLAVPDVVANMYIIESESGQAGPHILYRPLYAEALQQFSSRQSLLEAIASPGALQSSVLAWLSDSARSIYDNGGFQQPHYVRFGLGTEFGPLEVPKPAQLATDGASDELLQYLANGQLMEYLYGANARALVDQADRESVSNAESRWAVFLEGAGLLFNSLLLPLVRGPLMLAGWLLSLMASAVKDIPALNSEDPIARELAWVDLLVNIAMLTFQLAPSATPPTPVPAGSRWKALRSPFERQLTEQWPTPVIEQGPVLLDGNNGGLSDTVFDFSFSSARNRLTAQQQQRLWQFQTPKPHIIPAVVESGPRRGLYNHLRDWYAVIDRRWYQVRMEAGRVVIVDPFNTRRHGPYLQSDDQGNWSLDLQLRLRGGMPPKRRDAIRQQKAQRKQQLKQEWDHFIRSRTETHEGRVIETKSQQETLQKKADIAERLMNLANNNPKSTTADRARMRKAFDAALNEQTRVYKSLIDSRNERNELNIPLDTSTISRLMENTVNNARKSVVLADLDRQALYAAHPNFRLPVDQLIPMVVADPTGYTGFIKDLIVINERQMIALELTDNHLQELFNLGRPGEEAYNRLTVDRPAELTAIALKFSQLHNLKYLSNKDLKQGFIRELDLLLSPLGQQVRTHSELNQLNLSAPDRLAVLDSLLLQYGQVIDGMQGMALVHADKLNMAYFQQTQALLNSLYQDVVLQLAAEVKPVAEAAKKAPKRTLNAPGKPQKKVIKTRKQGVLIGNVKAAGTTLPIEAVEVRFDEADDLSGTYTQHEDAWDDVKIERKPQPELPPDTRALNIVKGDARKRVNELQAVIDRETAYAKVSRYPIEIQESLETEARRFDNLAQELERALSAQPQDQHTAADRKLVTELRTAHTTLKAKGNTLRIERTLQILPTDSHVMYLLEQDAVQLARLGARVALRGDFIQEYAVNHKGGSALWYAHFHYPQLDTPKHQYSVAHLKTKEQRTDSYHSLLARAQSPQEVVDVHRGKITLGLAERFLALAN
jgi:hypothetical protein